MRPSVSELAHRGPTLRQGETVLPLELFFDLVFVLAITQVTALMANEPTWAGLAKGMFVLAAMWWAWTGYAWLTSVVDPEAGIVRLAIAAAMVGLMVCALCIPHVFNSNGVLFVAAYTIVRTMQLLLFVHASADEPALRKSTAGLAAATIVASGLLLTSTQFDGYVQASFWALALTIDFGGGLLADSSGWKLTPGHFTERHGLIVIIALGESIVSAGAAAADVDLTTGVVVAAMLAVALAFAMWWAYFDVVALVVAERLAAMQPGERQNVVARDTYSYLHLPMIAGIVLVALGLKKTLGHVDEELKLVPAVALLGGYALYLLAFVGVRFRNIRTVSKQRLLVALLMLAAIPLATEVASLLTLAFVTVVACGLVAYEYWMPGEVRARVRSSA
jgi:low temperature requirement protein LtrA